MKPNSYWALLQKENPTDFDIALLKELFKRKKPGEKKVVEKKTTRAYLISEKKLQAMEISFKQKGPTPDELVDALLALDEEVIEPDSLPAFEKSLPSTEEMKSLKAFKGNQKDLTFGEKVALRLLEIPMAPERLKFWKMQNSIPTLFNLVRVETLKLKLACDWLRTDPSFKRILSFVLRIGNILNEGTMKGGAFGFNFDILRQISGTKSPQDTSISLLKFIVIQLDKHYPEALSAVQGHEIFLSAQFVGIEGLSGDININKKDLESLKSILPKFEEIKSEKDLFFEKMDPFYQKAILDIETAEKQIAETKEYFYETATHFCHNQQQPKNAEFFGVLVNFLKDFDKLTKQYKKEKDDAEKKKRIEERKKKKEQEKKERTKSVKKLEGKRNILDEIKAQMNKDDAFEIKTEIPNKKKNNNSNNDDNDDDDDDDDDDDNNNNENSINELDELKNLQDMLKQESTNTFDNTINLSNENDLIKKEIEIEIEDNSNNNSSSSSNNKQNGINISNNIQFNNSEEEEIEISIEEDEF